MKPKKIYIRRLDLLTVGLIFFLFISCNKETETGHIDYSIPVQTIKNANIIRSNGAKAEVQIKSQLILNYEGDSARMVFPEGVCVWFYDNDLKVKNYLESLYAINYQNSSKVYLRDSILIIDYINKDSIYCEELVWDKSKEIIYSNKTVKRVGENGISWGDGFESNENMDSLKIRNPRGTHYIYEEEI